MKQAMMECVAAWQLIVVEDRVLSGCNTLVYLHVLFPMLEDIQVILMLG